MLDSKVFTQCIESDSLMVINICSIAKRELGDQFDLFLVSREDKNENLLFTGFDPEEGSVR